MLNPLFRENPWRDLFRRDFDEILNRMLTDLPTWTEPKFTSMGFIPPVEAWLDPSTEKFHLRMALPGIEPHEIELHAQGNLLMIKGERKTPPPKKDVNYLYREFHYGNFERTLPLPEAVDADRLIAEFNHGVLEVTAPVVTGTLPRRIEIKGLTKKVGA